MQRASDDCDSSGEHSRPGLLPHRKRSLRAWLHLIKCSKQVEQAISDLFRTRHASSLARFDVLAHLEHAGAEGLTTTVLGQRLLASKGNISRLLDRMAAGELITRRASAHDRRVYHIVLTPKGAETFRRMAQDHEVWADTIFGVLNAQELDELVDLLDRVRKRVDEQG